MAKKIMCTNRILLKTGKVIYCSCDIVREVRKYLVRVNQRMAPVRGMHDELVQELQRLSKNPYWESHFPKSSRLILENPYGA